MVKSVLSSFFRFSVVFAGAPVAPSSSFFFSSLSLFMVFISLPAVMVLVVCCHRDGGVAFSLSAATCSHGISMDNEDATTRKMKRRID